MLKSTKILIGMGTLSVAAAGTMSGLYGYEVSHRKERIEDKNLKSIFDNINHIRSLSGLNDMSEDYDTFKEDIIDHIAEKDISMKEEVVTVLSENLTEAKDELLKEVADSSVYQDNQKALLKAEIDRLNFLLAKEMEIIKSGIVGDHDINYYQGIIEDSVGTGQFQDLESSVDSLDADLATLQNEIDGNQAVITNLNTKITTSQTDITNISTDLTNLKATVKTLDDKVASNTATFVEVNEIIDEIEKNLATNTNKIDSLGNDLDAVKIELASNSTTISRLDLEAQKMNEHLKTHTSLIDELKIKVNTLETSYLALNDTHKTEMDAVNVSLNTLLAADKKLNDDLINKTDSLLAQYNNLKTKVDKNEVDILDLVLKYNNLDAKVTGDLAALKKFFVDEQTQQNIDVATNFAEIQRLELLVLANTTEIDNLKNQLGVIRGDIATLKTDVVAINDTLKKYERKFAEIEIDLADAVQATDDLEVALRGEINDNEAKILGLDTRIKALENATAGSSADLLYQKADMGAPTTGYMDLWNSPFYSPKDLSQYRRLELMIYGHATGRYHNLDINLDTTDTIFDYSGGARVHPNRNWWGMKIDYVNQKMNYTFIYEAGNASWVWHSQLGRISVMQIYGVK